MLKSFKHHHFSFTALVTIWMLVASAPSFAISVLMYDDGSGSPIDGSGNSLGSWTKVFGDVMYDTPYNLGVQPGQPWDGTIIDVAPLNTNTNNGIVFKDGALGVGVNNGTAIRLSVPVPQGQQGNRNFVYVGAYSTMRYIPYSRQAPKWQKLARVAFNGGNPNIPRPNAADIKFFNNVAASQRLTPAQFVSVILKHKNLGLPVAPKR